ncbi:hypothetical protein B0H14DRAFT_2568518 [Mycena olivaceomarginata]|nr:hypothetical protein B0H14DRAFT_2568518 [Mycena olivaceomarginata]
MAEKLSILYVLPPYGFREQAQDALTATDWSETEFDEHEIATALSAPQTRGYIFSDWPGKLTGPVNFLPGKDSWKDVLLQEMVWSVAVCKTLSDFFTAADGHSLAGALFSQSLFQMDWGELERPSSRTGFDVNPGLRTDFGLGFSGDVLDVV